MRMLRGVDSPWHRLPWTLPTALLISVAALWGLAYFMGKPTHRPVEPPPIDAQLIEQSVPTETPSPQPEPPAGVSQPKPVPLVRPHPAPVKPKVRHRPKPQPVSEVKPEPVPERPLVRPPTNPNPVAQEPKVLTTNATAPRGVSATPGTGQATAGMKTSSSSGTPAGSYAGRGSSGGSMYANSGARKIFHPLPQIPEDLREEAFNSAALARFHIAVDGNVEVELVRPTQNPRLNRILLDTLKKWKFFPAIKNGNPVASTVDILVKIEVR